MFSTDLNAILTTNINDIIWKCHHQTNCLCICMENKMILYFYTTVIIAEIFKGIKFCCFKHLLLTLTLKIKPQILSIFSAVCKTKSANYYKRVVNHENYNPYTQPAT